MCGRFYLDVQQDELKSHFDLALIPDLIPRYNIAPAQNVAAVLYGAKGRELSMLHWGLIPSWAKDKKIGYRTINARAETVATKPAFRAAFKRRRCLIPASGFFEWKAERGAKQPYCIHPRSGRLFAFAGLYEHWQASTGEAIDSCTILVTAANSRLQPVHDRMPVILASEHYATWLDPQNNDPAVLEPLLKSWPSDEIALYAVSKRVNNPRNDEPGCIAPIE
jgi:putative SOS response-associated peptidase YedK